MSAETFSTTGLNQSRDVIASSLSRFYLIVGAPNNPGTDFRQKHCRSETRRTFKILTILWELLMGISDRGVIRLPYVHAYRIVTGLLSLILA